ncbi:MAG TPA: polyprenyl diphosphate synthase [Candidatus Bathyarchaeia archaeon]|nr:polyprenyl diphosphate synthase [Candidatus Bathyarchaeia archaeon]
MSLPKHVAIIVDGDRRWARKKGLPDISGHKYVTDKIIEPIIFRCLELSIPYVTFWAFSTENWKRGKRFASALFSLLRQGLRRSMERYKKAGVRLNTIGDLSKLPKDLVKDIKHWQDESKNNKKITVTMALNYGGRDEIIRAINKLIKSKSGKHLRGEVAPAAHLGGEIVEKDLEQYLDTHSIPDPDLIIRTGGSQRMSGFMLWQAEYAEFYFTDVLMPDFTVKKLDRALKEFSRRQRRFGK